MRFVLLKVGIIIKYLRPKGKSLWSLYSDDVRCWLTVGYWNLLVARSDRSQEILIYSRENLGDYD